MISTAILKLIILVKITVGVGTCFCEKKSIDVIHEYFDKKRFQAERQEERKGGRLIDIFYNSRSVM